MFGKRETTVHITMLKQSLQVNSSIRLKAWFEREFSLLFIWKKLSKNLNINLLMRLTFCEIFCIILADSFSFLHEGYSMLDILGYAP